MLYPCVIVFCASPCFPLRHIVTVSQSRSEFSKNEFKDWYYGEYNKVSGDQFVYCDTQEQMDSLLKKLKGASAYHISVPIWGDVGDEEGESCDYPASRMKPFTKVIQDSFDEFLSANPIPIEEMHQPCIFCADASIVEGDEGPVMDLIIWLDKDDISEREWNNLFENLDKMLLTGWGAEFSTKACEQDGKTVFVNFGKNPDDEHIDYAVRNE